VLQFLARFANPLVVLLLAAAVLSAGTGDVASSWILAGVILLSVTLDFVQEYRAGRAADSLKASVALRASVLRDGRWAEVPAAGIVPGDVVQLQPGGLVPADGRVLDARDFFVNEALLTGEPYPVEKRADPADPDAATGVVSMGTSVVGGSATVLVSATGRDTALGKIHDTLARRPPATAFELGIHSFGMLILKVAVLMVLFVLLVNGVLQRPWLESFLFAVALAVGLTPELLPMIVSVTLARGALRMAKERVIVKHLPAIHDLGSMDVLCTDKTGTLTEARIRLMRALDCRGRPSPRVLELAVLNSSMQTGPRNPLDDAILEQAGEAVARWTKVDEVPFDFERRCVTVLADDGSRRLLVHKGAFEDILAHCTRWEAEAGQAAQPLDGPARQQLVPQFEELSRQGLRVLGIASKETPRDHAHAVVNDESELVFAGLLAFEDPPKQSAAEAIRGLAAAGVQVKVVTGDNELVTQHLCAELGMPVTGVLTGNEIRALTDTALAARAGDVSLFCRVTPPLKNRVILALRSRGHVVGYLGDGINDAPPLHSAHVGISVAGAVDVAREAADLILLDPDLGVLHRGIREGRRTFGNIMKYVMMGTSSNFGNMLSMAVGTLVLPFLPLLPIQILCNNFLYDLSEIPIPLDRMDEEFVARPHHWNLQQVRSFMLLFGPISSVFDFLTFFLLLRWFRAGEALFHTGWFVESLATQVLVIFVIRTRGNPLRSRAHPVLVLTSLVVVAVAATLPFTPLGSRLGFVPLSAPFFGALAALAVAYLAIVQAMKAWFYRRFATG